MIEPTKIDDQEWWLKSLRLPAIFLPVIYKTNFGEAYRTPWKTVTKWEEVVLYYITKLCQSMHILYCTVHLLMFCMVLKDAFKI